jgi:hypothetical protein
MEREKLMHDIAGMINDYPDVESWLSDSEEDTVTDHVDNIIDSFKRVDESRSIKINGTYGKLIPFGHEAYDISSEEFVDLDRNNGSSYNFYVKPGLFTKSKETEVTHGIRVIISYTQHFFGDNAIEIRKYLRKLIVGTRSTKKGCNVITIADAHCATSFYRKLMELFRFGINPCDTNYGPLITYIPSDTITDEECRFVERSAKHTGVFVIFTDKVESEDAEREIYSLHPVKTYESRFQDGELPENILSITKELSALSNPADMFAWIFMPQSMIQECWDSIKSELYTAHKEKSEEEREEEEKGEEEREEEKGEVEREEEEKGEEERDEEEKDEEEGILVVEKDKKLGCDRENKTEIESRRLPSQDSEIDYPTAKSEEQDKKPVQEVVEPAGPTKERTEHEKSSDTVERNKKETDRGETKVPEVSDPSCYQIPCNINFIHKMQRFKGTIKHVLSFIALCDPSSFNNIGAQYNAYVTFCKSTSTEACSISDFWYCINYLANSLKL